MQTACCDRFTFVCKDMKLGEEDQLIGVALHFMTEMRHRIEKAFEKCFIWKYTSSFEIIIHGDLSPGPQKLLLASAIILGERFGNQQRGTRMQFSRKWTEIGKYNLTNWSAPSILYLKAATSVQNTRKCGFPDWSQIQNPRSSKNRNINGFPLSSSYPFSTFQPGYMG